MFYFMITLTIMLAVKGLHTLLQNDIQASTELIFIVIVSAFVGFIVDHIKSKK